ncbi:MAG: hypothetical protein WC243_04415 [Patescibacteria group bacterium]
MYYILALLLLIVIYYLFVKVLSSLAKGCITVVLFGIAASIVVVFVRSRKAPVNIFGYYVIDNFEVRKL